MSKLSRRQALATGFGAVALAGCDSPGRKTAEEAAQFPWDSRAAGLGPIEIPTFQIPIRSVEIGAPFSEYDRSLHLFYLGNRKRELTVDPRPGRDVSFRVVNTGNVPLKCVFTAANSQEVVVELMKRGDASADVHGTKVNLIATAAAWGYVAISTVALNYEFIPPKDPAFLARRDGFDLSIKPKPGDDPAKRHIRSDYYPGGQCVRFIAQDRPGKEVLCSQSTIGFTQPDNVAPGYEWSGDRPTKFCILNFGPQAFDYNFGIDRKDLAVQTTRVKLEAGMATPWLSGDFYRCGIYQLNGGDSQGLVLCQ